MNIEKSKSSFKLDSQKIDIHHYGVQIEAAEKLCRKELSEHNAKLIIDMSDSFLRLGLSPAHRLATIRKTKQVTLMYGKDWHKDITRDEVNGLVTAIMKKHAPDGPDTNTSGDYKKFLKLFLRFYITGIHTLPLNTPELDCVIGIVSKRPASKLRREDLITPEEKERLLIACAGDAQLRAFIDLLWDSGGRPGEVLNLYLKDVIIDYLGYQIKVDGKTYPHPIDLVESIPNISIWLNSHPFIDNKSHPLWIKRGNRNFGVAWDYNYAEQALQALADKAEIKKKIFLNLFRHSEITRNYKLNDSAKKKRHGWSKSTKMLDNYEKLIDEDVRESFLELQGVKSTKEPVVELYELCMTCGARNKSTDLTCYKCHQAISLDAKVKLGEIPETIEIPKGVNADAIKFMFTLMKDQKLLEKYMKQNTQ